MCMSSWWWYCDGLWKVFAYIEQTNKQIEQKQKAERKTIQKWRFQTVFAEQFYWTALFPEKKPPKNSFVVYFRRQWWCSTWSPGGVKHSAVAAVDTSYVELCRHQCEREERTPEIEKQRTNEHVNRTDFISRRFYDSRAIVVTIIINIAIMWADLSRANTTPFLCQSSLLLFYNLKHRSISGVMHVLSTYPIYTISFNEAHSVALFLLSHSFIPRSFIERKFTFNRTD